MSDYVEQNYTNKLKYPGYNLYTSNRAEDRGHNFVFRESSPWVQPLSTNRWSRGGQHHLFPPTPSPRLLALLIKWFFCSGSNLIFCFVSPNSSGPQHSFLQL